MGIFSKAGINSHRGSGGGIYFLCQDDGSEAQYRVRLQRVVATRTRMGEPNFIIETEVITSTHKLRPLGSHPSQAIVIRGAAADAAPGNIADFCRVGLACLIAHVQAAGPEALAELDKALRQWDLVDTADLVKAAAAEQRFLQPDMVVLSDKGVEEWIGGEENPLGELQLDVRAFNKNKRNGEPFTRVEWSVPTDVSTRAADAQAA